MMTEPTAAAEEALHAIVWPLHIVFDGPPAHESGRFVEVIDATGNSVNAGEWVKYDPFWDLVIQAPLAASPPPSDADAALVAEVLARIGFLKWCGGPGSKTLLCDTSPEDVSLYERLASRLQAAPPARKL